MIFVINILLLIVFALG